MKNEKNEFLTLLCNLYLVVLLVILPLYTGKGYWQLGDIKYMLFRNLSFLCLGGWLIAGMPRRMGNVIYLWKKQGGNREGRKISFSVVDWAVLAYGGCAVLSALCSSYGRLAWEGYAGWYMGALSQVLFAAVYFFVSRQYNGARWPVRLGEGALFLATVLGLLHRLGIDPLGLMAAWNSGDWEYSHMLSTLGNINWLCGYYSVALAILMEHYLQERRRWVLILLYPAAVSVFVLLGLQGSQSGWLLLAVCTGLCVFSGSRRKTVRKMSLLLVGFFLGMPLMYFLMELQGGKAAVVADGNPFEYVKWYLWPLGAAVCLVPLFFSGRWRDSGGRHRSFLEKGLERIRRQSKRLKAGLAVGVLGGVFLGILLGYVVVSRSVGDGFGSGRGFLWKIALEGFAQADGKDKLLGAGPDCYGEAIFNRLGAETKVWDGEHWEGAVFTNAHSEFLSQLCNVGILGSLSYLAVFLAGLYRYWADGAGIRMHRRAGGAGPGNSRLGLLAIVMYGLHSLISFQQVLNTPLLFLVLGLCEAGRRAGMLDSPGGHNLQKGRSTQMQCVNAGPDGETVSGCSGVGGKRDEMEEIQN